MSGLNPPPPRAVHIGTVSSGGSLAQAGSTPAEVATMFRVDPKTVTRWA
jgi:hypothetical protein